MKVDIIIPSVGESVTEATIGKWLKKSGDYIKKNEALLELETDKASVEVVSEHDGVVETLNKEGDVVAIGAVVAKIDTSAAKPAAAEAKTETKPTESSAAKSSPAPSHSNGGGKDIHADLKSHLSPAVQKVVTENKLDPQAITGTGRDGRITKGDALAAVEGAANNTETKAESTQQAPSVKSPAPSSEGRQKRVPMTSIRKKIAERLVLSQQTTATLTTFNEIDMSRVMEMRAKYKDKFKEKYNVSLGFMGFFAKASIEALKTYSAVNAFLEGNDLVYNNYVNIGVAVGTEKGLLVPVIKDADRMSIAEIEMAIRDYALKARDGKISITDLSGGTFTISNGGVYGSMLSTPILNPPQTGILGLHKIEDRPIALNGEVAIRPMMYVALSYDHRVIDGKEAVSFLVKLKEGMEDPERLLLEI